MDRLGRSRWLVLLALCFVFSSASAFAQANSGDLTGKVFDSSGAAIPTATVVALNDATGVRSTTQVSGDGIYRFSNLPIGKYSLTASAVGFATGYWKLIHDQPRRRRATPS